MKEIFVKYWVVLFPVVISLLCSIISVLTNSQDNPATLNGTIVSFLTFFTIALILCVIVWALTRNKNDSSILITEVGESPKIKKTQPGSIEIILIFLFGLFGFIYAFANNTWTKKSRSTMLWLILFFPVGLYRMFRYSDWKLTQKITVISYISLKFILIGLIAYISIFYEASGHYKEFNVSMLNSEERKIFDDVLIYRYQEQNIIALQKLRTIETRSYSVEYLKCDLLIDLRQLPDAEDQCNGLYEGNTHDPFLSERLSRLYFLKNDCHQSNFYSEHILALHLNAFDRNIKKQLYIKISDNMVSCKANKEKTIEMIDRAIKVTDSYDSRRLLEQKKGEVDKW